MFLRVSIMSLSFGVEDLSEVKEVKEVILDLIWLMILAERTDFKRVLARLLVASMIYIIEYRNT